MKPMEHSYRVIADKEKNRLYIDLCITEIEQAGKIEDEIWTKAKQLAAGWCCIKNYTALELPLTTDLLDKLETVMSFLKPLGMGQLVRVLTEAQSSLGDELKNRSIKIAGYEGAVARTIQDAETICRLFNKTLSPKTSDIQFIEKENILKPIAIDPKTFLLEHCRLPALPEAVIRIQEMIQDEGTDTTMIAQIMSGDPSLVAQVLAVVNSVYYSLPKTISNIKYAVAYLGLSVIQRIVISVGVVNTIGIREKKEFNNYWYHSFFTALTTKYLSKKFWTYSDPEELWTASILHDIGKLLYIKFFPEHYKELKRYCEENGCLFSDAEEYFKLPSSSSLGSLLCHHWGLPGKVEDACNYHNLSHMSKQGSDFQTIIALGNLLAELAAGGLNESCKNRIKELAENILKLTPDSFLSIMADIYSLESEAEKFLKSL